LSDTEKMIYKSKSLSKLLFEQEDLFADDADDAEEADAEEADAEGEDTEEADTEGEEAGGEEAAPAEGEEESEEDEKLDVDLDDEVKLSKSIDQDLEALLIDFETDARKSREIDDQADAQVAESLRLGMLLEQDDYEEQIDLDRFTSEVARLVKNYTSLLDMEKMLVSKAREFVATRYGEEAEKDLVDMLSVQHDIDIQEPETSAADSQSNTPVAVGAGAGATGGAA